jgi:hypothetical protein
VSDGSANAENANATSGVAGREVGKNGSGNVGNGRGRSEKGVEGSGVEDGVGKGSVVDRENGDEEESVDGKVVAEVAMLEDLVLQAAQAIVVEMKDRDSHLQEVPLREDLVDMLAKAMVVPNSHRLAALPQEDQVETPVMVAEVLNNHLLEVLLRKDQVGMAARHLEVRKEVPVDMLVMVEVAHIVGRARARRVELVEVGRKARSLNEGGFYMNFTSIFG